MIAAPAAGAEPVVSFRDAQHASVVLHKLDGSVSGWPLHMLTHWSLGPTAANRTHELSITIGDATIRIGGERLTEITIELAACERGLEMHAYDLRYRALADPKRPFIFSITVEDQKE